MKYFDEEWYLQNYGDVRIAIERGDVSSARDHFRAHGEAEGRRTCDPKLFAKLVQADKMTSNFCQVDQFVVTNRGHALALGWLDNRVDHVEAVTFIPAIGAPIPLETRMLRYYREDVVEKKAKEERNFDHGFWIFFGGLSDCLPFLGGTMRIEFASGLSGQMELVAQVVSPNEMRGRVLDALSRPIKYPQPLARLWQVVGPDLQKLNLEIAARTVLEPPVIHGARTPEAALSIVVATSKPDWLLRQAAIFSSVAGLDDVEFIWMNCQPEAAHRIQAIARNAHSLYGLRIVSLSTSESIGLAAASSGAVEHAKAENLLFIGDGVFPGDRDCLVRAIRVAEELKGNDVAGAMLLTENNSIQHVGRKFKLVDSAQRFWAEEGLEKGMPAADSLPRSPMAADSVDFAAMLVKRSAFLRLGGFDRGYISDEYQGADYCLRAREAGGLVMVDPRLLFYRVERRPPLPHPRDWALAFADMASFNHAWAATIDRLHDGEDEPTAVSALMERGLS